MGRTNTFKYVSFTDRIARINVELIRTGRSLKANPDVDHETFFGEEIERLQDLDYTNDFTKLLEDLPPDIGHFSQLLFFKKEISSALLQSFQLSKPVCLGSLLKLTVALCRDLHADFHVFFWDFFDQLISLVHVHGQDAELVEQLFTCLAYLVKFMWRELLEEQDKCLQKFLPLFSHRKVFVRRFSSEAFAFLCRKIKSHKSFYAICFDSYQSEEEIEGLAELIFQTVKGVKKQLHSCADEIFPVILQFLEPKLIQENAVYHILRSVFERLQKHLDPSYAGSILVALLDNLKNLEDGSKPIPINCTSSLLAGWVDCRNGVFVCEDTVTAAEIAQALNLLHQNFMSSETLLLSTQLLEKKRQLDSGIMSEVVQNILFSVCGSTIDKMNFLENLLNQGLLDSEMETIKQFVVEHCFASPELSQRCLLLLAGLVESKCSLPKDGDGLGQLSQIDLNLFSMYESPSKKQGGRGSKSVRRTDPSMLHAKYFNGLSQSMATSAGKLLAEDDIAGFCCILSFIRIRPHIYGPLPAENQKPAGEDEQEMFNMVLAALTDEQNENIPVKHRLLLLKAFQLIVVNQILDGSQDRFLSSEEIILNLLKIPIASDGALNFLRLLDYCLHVQIGQNTGALSAKLLSLVYSKIEAHLLSPYHEIRRVALVILNRFSDICPEFVVKDEKLQLFSLMLACENLPLDLTSHREKLRLYRKLAWTEYQNIRLEDPLFAFVGLRYLIGCLYLNFSLLWDPLMDIIESHVKGLSNENNEDFWRLLDEILIISRDRAVNHIFNPPPLDSSTIHVEEQATGSNCQFWLNEDLGPLTAGDRPDHVHFRILILKSISKCIGIVEPHNRIVTKFFLEFIDNEYKHPQLQTASIQDLTDSSVVDDEAAGDDEDIDSSNNIIKTSSDVTGSVNMTSQDASVDVNLEDSYLEEDSSEEIEQDEQEVVPNNSAESAKPVPPKLSASCADKKVPRRTTKERMSAKLVKQKRKLAQSGVIKSLLAYLDLYAKFRNPQALWKEPKLLAFYKELLLSSNLGLQSAAFRCIFGYRYPWLVSYRDNFDRLLDEKTFSDELVTFGLTLDENTIDQTHRPQILDLLLRFLYGRLMMKPKAGGVHRHQIIRFLCGCQQAELNQFLDLIFALMKHIIGPGQTACQILETTIKNFDPTRCIPLKRLLGLLHMLTLLIRYIGNMISDSQPTMLKAIVVTGGIYQAIAAHGVASKYRTSLKTMRKLLFARLQQFNTHFDDYKYTMDEVEAIFSGVVWPECSQIQRFITGQDAFVNPAPVIQLFLAWSEVPRLFELFGFRGNANQKVAIVPVVDALGSVVQLLRPAFNLNLGQKESMLRLVQNLLTIADLSDDGDGTNIGVDLEHLEAGKLPDINLGTKLLLPYSDVILENIRERMSGRGSKKTPSARDLTILQRIAEHCSDSSQADSLVSMLLDMLTRDVIKHETVHVKAVTTIGLLISSCQNLAVVIRPIAKLFGKFTGRFARDALCESLRSLAKVNGQIAHTSDIVSRMNSWDPKRVDEPNYDLRLSVMTEITRMCSDRSDKDEGSDQKEDSVEMDADAAELILHNLAYFVKNSVDLSLRDTASYTLQVLIKHLPLAMKMEDSRKLINELNAHIRQGLRSETEAIRLECISILRVAVATFPQYPRYSGLANLMNADLDLDFFENMKHIQLHRRARAIMRLVNQVSGRPTAEAHNQKSSAKGKTHSATTKSIMATFNASSGDSNPLSSDAPVTSSVGIPTNKSESVGKIYFPTDVMTSFLVPIVTPYILDDAYVKHTNLIHEAVNVLGEVALKLDWFRYLPMLQFYINRLQKEPERQKVLIKALVKILDAFHFSLDPSQVDPSSAISAAVDTGGNVENMGEVQVVEPVDAPIAEPDIQKPVFSGKIYTVVKTQILPKLQQAITKKLSGDSVHSKSQSAAQTIADDVDFESLRAPIALALVKLLRKMPDYLLKQSLPSILAKVCQLLKSRSFDVRETTRKTLINIIETLGIDSLGQVIHEMQSLLSRGYQLHVMNHSVFFLLDRLSSSDSLQGCDYDSIVTIILQIAQTDLFGAVAEEKTIEEVRRHVPEARSNKIYRTFAILGSHVTEKGFQQIVNKLVEWLDSEQRHKAVKMVTKLSKSLCEGIVATTLMESQSVLVILHSVLSDNLPMISNKIVESKQKDEQNKALLRPDTYLIAQEPGRAGPQPVTSKKSSRHTVVEFSFEVLHGMLKHVKLNKQDPKHLAMLDPFVNFIMTAINSKQPRITCLALRCLNLLIHFDLPKLTETSKEIFEQGFVLLNHYGGLGVALRGDSSDVLLILFKVLTTMIRDSRHGTLNDRQMQVLLQYVEQDLYDSNRQATAFSLLKVMVKQRIDCPEMHDLISKVTELMIQSPANHIRSQCRQVFLIYLLEYKLGKQLSHRIEFVLAQLDYEDEDGRLSCLEMLMAIFTHFPQSLLDNYATLAFLQLSVRLVNDESPKCRLGVSGVLGSLLEKVSPKKREELFGICLKFHSDLNKTVQCRLAMLIISTFSDVEKDSFDKRIAKLLALVKDGIAHCLKSVEEQTHVESSVQADLDSYLYQALSTLLRFANNCPSLGRSAQWAELLNRVLENVQSCLTYPFNLVRLQAARVFGYLFASYEPGELVPQAGGMDVTMVVRSPEYLLKHTDVKLEKLWECFCHQLRTPVLQDELADQVVKNLVYLAKVVALKSGAPSITGMESGSSSPSQTHPPANPGDQNSTQRKAGVDHQSGDEDVDDLDVETRVAANQQTAGELTIEKVAHEMARIARFEVIRFAKEFQKRTAVIKWIGAIALELPKEIVIQVLPDLVAVVQREIVLDNQNETIKLLAMEVSELLKQAVGMEVYGLQSNRFQQGMRVKRESRKRERAVEVVTDPEKAARRRLKKQKTKSETKKKKMMLENPLKRRRKKPTEIES